MDLPAAIPLFPLPDHVLLPGVASPYRLFEPRYRALAAALDALPEASRFLAIPRLATSNLATEGGREQVAPVAALTIARQLTFQADGTWLLVAEGVARVALTPVICDTPFRQAAVTLLPDQPEDSGDLATLIDGVRGLASHFRLLLGERGALLDAVLVQPEPVLLIDQLGALLLGPADERQAFLEERRASARALRVRQVLLRLTGSRGEPSLN